MTELRLIDARGPRFAAAVTAVVLAITLLITPSVTGVVLLVVQALAFGAAAFMGIRYQPYGWFFRRFLAPRLGPVKDLEDPAPPRFAQAVGLLFVLAALVGLSFSQTLVAQIAIGFALAAAFLNAVFKFCLGCEVYLLIKRMRTRGSRRRSAAKPILAAAEGAGDDHESEVVPTEAEAVAEIDEAPEAASAQAEAEASFGAAAETDDVAVDADDHADESAADEIDTVGVAAEDVPADADDRTGEADDVAADADDRDVEIDVRSADADDLVEEGRATEAAEPTR